MDTDVIIVGAGPVGLLLAAELHLAGAQTLVLERLAEPVARHKARGVGPLAAEALQRRGLGEQIARFHAAGQADKARDHGSEKGHFGWIHKIDPALQEASERAAVLIWQPDLEAILAEHAAALGVPVLRERTVRALEQDSAGVTVTVAAPDGERAYRATYVVGCDGGGSTVRKLAGFDFVGTAPVMTARAARVELADASPLPPPGRTDRGTFGYGPGFLSTITFDAEQGGGSGALTATELQDSVRRVSGADIVITDLSDPLRFTDHARQVTSYRDGRILLAGDAAHVHSPNGGQGLNLGLVDAANLGWKLAAHLRGNAPEGLLDSYTAERHPVGAAVLHNTRAQSALMRPGPHTDALRDIVGELMDLPEVNRYFGTMLSGLGVRYDLPYGTSHPLAGMHCPDLGLIVDGESRRLYEFTVGGGFLLVTADPRYAAGIDMVRAEKFDREDLAAVLLRPDGVVAWAAAPGITADPAELEAALHTWCAS